MYHTKVCYENYKFDPRAVAVMLYNMSICKWGPMIMSNNAKNEITVNLDKSCTKLMYHGNFELVKDDITCSEEWICIQKNLNRLDGVTILIIKDILKLYPLKLLSIISAILSFPIDYDVKHIILSHVFINLEKSTTFYAYVGDEWRQFYVAFGQKCHYVAKIMTQEIIIKQLIDHFVTTKMDSDVNIMCTSESFTAFILHNEKRCCADFTFLTFDHASHKITMYLFDVSDEHIDGIHDDILCPSIINDDCDPINVNKLPFNFNKMHKCTIIFHSNDNTFKLTKKCINLLVSGIVGKLKYYGLEYENDNLFC